MVPLSFRGFAEILQVLTFSEELPLLCNVISVKQGTAAVWKSLKINYFTLLKAQGVIG